MTTVSRTVLIALLAAAAGAGGSYLLLGPAEQGPAESATAGSDARDPEPLYWVAPMDPSYRRDGPGKSPMGMDLVPVYEDAATAGDTSVIRIAPEVVNNLGVRTAPVAYAALPTRIRTVGYVQYDEDRLIHIHPRVEGWIEKLHVKASGDPVEAGQPLYELYSPQLVNAQEEYLLALKRDNPRVVLRVPPLEIPPLELKMAWSPLLQHNPANKWLRKLIADTARELDDKAPTP